MKRLLIFLVSVTPFYGSGQNSEQDSLIRLLATESDSKHAYIYNQLSSLKFHEEKFREAADFAKKALQLARKFNNGDEEFYALTNLAYVYFDKGEMDTSIFYGNEALRLAEKTGNKTFLAQVDNHLGNAWSKISVFDKSLDCYLQSLQIVEDTLPGISRDRNLFYQSLLFNNIGTVYESMEQYDKALDYFERSLVIRRQQNDLNGMASCLQNIGVICEQNKNYDSTLLLYKEALEIRKSLGQESFVAELLMNTGIVYTKTGEYRRSEQNLREAIAIFEKLDKKRMLAFACLNLAKLFIASGQTAAVLPFIRKSLVLSEQHNYRVFERDARALLSDYYARQGDYKQAWENRNRQVALNDSVFSSEMTGKVTEMEACYESEKMEKEIEILSKDNEIKSLRVKRKSTMVIILVILVFVFILLLLITLLLLNRRRLKQAHTITELEKSKLLESKLMEENAHQGKQLTTHALNMLRKNKLLQELDKELKSFAPKTDEATMKKLSDIRRQINRNMHSEKDWELFRLYFEEVNRDFYQSLQEKSNELTGGDLKLAALIKLNLNIKEAAAVLNISHDSLRKARYRLRKKLGLFGRENLADYLNRIG